MSLCLAAQGLDSLGALKGIQNTTAACVLASHFLFSFCFLRSRVIYAITRGKGSGARAEGGERGSRDHIPTSPHQLKPLLSALMGEWHQHPQFLQSKADKVILLLMSHLYGEMSTGVFSHPNSCRAV